MNNEDTQAYLGDGVYGSFDGYQIWVQTGPENRIAIEPKVLDSLINYAIKVGMVAPPQ